MSLLFGRCVCRRRVWVKAPVWAVVEEMGVLIEGRRWCRLGLLDWMCRYTFWIVLMLDRVFSRDQYRKAWANSVEFRCLIAMRRGTRYTGKDDLFVGLFTPCSFRCLATRDIPPRWPYTWRRSEHVFCGEWACLWACFGVSCLAQTRATYQHEQWLNMSS